VTCPATVTLASPGDVHGVTVQCEAAPEHARTHSATIVGTTTLVMDGEQRAVSVNVYLVW
jgi:hypothetical protein